VSPDEDRAEIGIDVLWSLSHPGYRVISKRPREFLMSVTTSLEVHPPGLSTATIPLRYAVGGGSASLCHWYAGERNRSSRSRMQGRSQVVGY
jgi:hypothetical protein